MMLAAIADFGHHQSPITNVYLTVWHHSPRNGHSWHGTRAPGDPSCASLPALLLSTAPVFDVSPPVLPTVVLPTVVLRYSFGIFVTLSIHIFVTLSNTLLLSLMLGKALLLSLMLGKGMAALTCFYFR
jgi:hypothetical protein